MRNTQDWAVVLMAILACAGARGAEPVLSFKAHGEEYVFDTGRLRGKLCSQGRSMGLSDVVHVETGAAVSASMGLMSIYRLLDQETRYPDGWSWKSQSRLLPDGAVEVRWTADETHPFDMLARYRWTTADSLDMTTTLMARKKLTRMEVFVASYFAQFGEARVYANNDGRPQWIEATEADGVWQMFPRDPEAVAIIQDGRWKRPAHPVDWAIRPRLAGAVAMRRDAASGLTALVMARPEECFAVATPYGQEPHYSLYLCLMGKNLEAGESATAQARLTIGTGITQQRAIGIYEEYAKASR